MIRGVGLRGAIAVNVITMIGIGPLITIPLVVGKLHGGTALLGWIVGAVVALCDGLVWAELSSRFPGSGGTYVYLREAFGRHRWGRLFAFLFNWQFIFYAPLLLASGYIGFANYAAYLWPEIANPLTGGMVRVSLGILTIVLLYRRITSIAKISIVLCMTAIATLCIVIAASLPHANVTQAFATDMHPNLTWGFLLAVGSSLYLTLYDYVGYADAALIGEEVRDPNRTIPLSIVISVLLVALLYVVMQFGVLSVVPWHQMLSMSSAASQYIGTTVVELSWGRTAAVVFTVLVLITAFASLYGNLLGFARVPFAAARDGIFFPVFKHLHPSGQFPDVALLTIGAASIAASFFTLDAVIAYLTAAIVLVQAVAQITAVFVLRSKLEAPPFRMWLFPLPALVALAGWMFAFYSTGPLAIELSVASVLIGAIFFAGLAKVQRTWPFAAVLLAAICLTASQPASASYGHSAVVQQNGYPVFQVDGKPYFVYGAAFFYERLPKDRWSAALAAYKAMGINTIDLYVIWNWHELSDGDFDFTGRTDARRDLHSLFALIHHYGFKTIVRPGPVIRNEWKNGGYPDWLLKRDEYSMPEHDVLEGRYPATATLQNAHSDDAAAEWMANRSHMTYAPRWLKRVLTEIKPWSDDVIAIALDDDQGAYIDNQTWPAPHFQTYIKFLDATVHAVAPGVPTFINTYQMKVTASSPVWAWGNWYQSDAFKTGEHDRAQLEFSTALLQTQPDVPVMISEFQAGWLQGPDENEPRPADPSNTELAIGTMLQMGAHGIVNFPVQDTLNPPGYEAPFANIFYGWNAALSYAGSTQPRYDPTARMGTLLRLYGRALAQTHRVAHTAIVWPLSTLPANADVYKLSAATIALQQQYRAAGIVTDFIDPAFVRRERLQRYAAVVNPLSAAPPAPNTSGAGAEDVVLLAANTGRYTFAVITNYDDTAKTYGVFGKRIPVRARSTAIVPFGKVPVTTAPRGPGYSLRTQVVPSQLLAEPQASDVVLQSAAVTVAITPNAGARAFTFTDRNTKRNIFSTVGAFRDDMAAPIPPSPRDYIAKYTHQLAAGTFNRTYASRRMNGAAAEFQYAMPDAQVPITFNKSISMLSDGRSVSVRYFNQLSHPGLEAVSTSALTVEHLGSEPGTVFLITGLTPQPVVNDKTTAFAGEPDVALYDPKSGELAVIWSAAGLTGKALAKRGNVLFSLRYRADAPAAFNYGSYSAATLAEAISKLTALRGR